MVCPSRQKVIRGLKIWSDEWDCKCVCSEHNSASGNYWLTSKEDSQVLRKVVVQCVVFGDAQEVKRNQWVLENVHRQATRNQGRSGKDGWQLERVVLSKLRGSPQEVDREKSCRTWTEQEAAWLEKVTLSARQVISSRTERQTSSRVCLRETWPQISWLQNSCISWWVQMSAKQQTPLLQLHRYQT